MADETKKYIIDIESNLKEYADEAALAKKKVDELTAANKALKDSGKEGSAEFEANKAALKNANDEYRKAQTLLKTQIAYNQSETGSRKQLSEQLKLQEQALGKLGNAYITNAKGQRELNPLYITQRNEIAKTKQAIIDYDLALNDGRSNIGRYGVAVKGAMGQIAGLPGPLGNAASAVQSFSGKLLGLLKNPIVLVIAGITAALMLLVKAFKGNDEASEKFGGIMKGLSVVITEVLGRVVSLEKAVVNLFKGDFKGAAEEAKAAFTGLGKSIRDAYAAGSEQKKLANKIEDAEIALLEKIAKRNKEIAEIKKNSRDQDDSALKRSEDLRKAEDLEKANLSDMLSIQRDRVKLAELELNSTNKNQQADEQRKKVAEERAKLYDLETDSINAQDVIQKRILSVEKEIADERKKANDERKKQDIDAEKEAQSFIDKELARMDKAAEDKWNSEVEFQRILFEQRRKDGQAEYDAMIAQEQALADAVVQIHESMNDSKMRIAIAATNVLSSLSGENKTLQTASLIADKAFAIAQVVIQTTKANATLRAMAAASVLPGPGYLIRLAASMAAVMAPINLNRVAAAADIATIVAAAAMQLKSASQSSISSSAAPTAISSSAPAQRIFAQSAGSSILNQPQLSQTQLNAIPNQNLLTADAIAMAISKLPPPIVTVEDINVRSSEVEKIAVRATI